MAGKRAGNGAGSIIHYKNGDVGIRFTVEVDAATGKQTRRTVRGRTLTDCRKQMRKIQKTIDEGTYCAPADETVSMWLMVWLDEYNTHLKPTTLAAYTWKIKRYIIPVIGNVRLTNLTTGHLQRMYNSLYERNNGQNPLSASSVRDLHRIIHTALGKAVKLRKIAYNPSDHCELKKVEREEQVVLNTAEQKLFLQAIKGNPYETLFYIDLLTGLRLSEILGLQWDDVDFAQGAITIRQQLQYVRGKGYHLIRPKNGKERKLFPAMEVMEALREQREQQDTWKAKEGIRWKDNYDLVFTSRHGKHYTQVTIERHAREIMRSIGKPQGHFHTLRHTCATNLMHATGNAKLVQACMGHHDAAFTLNVYGHVSDDVMITAGQVMSSHVKTLL